MNDRYLYRAKRTDNGEWVEGNLVWSDDADDDYKAIIIPTTGSNMFTRGVSNGDLGFEKWYRVDPSTICQCTAVPDRDKKIMYENDVVRASGGVRGVIRFGRYGVEKNDYGFYVEWEKSHPYWRNDIYYWKSELRVIGSYIDNPELLEVGE